LLPSYGLLVLSTWWTEGRFDEKDLNITYVIGLFAGIVVAVAHNYFALYSMESGAFILSGSLLAIAEVLLYHVYVNRKKLKGRTDSPYMAFSFSLGISGIYLLYLTGHYFRNADIGPESLLGLLLFCISVPLARGGTALLYSRGSGRTTVPYIAAASAVLGLYNVSILIYLGWEFLWPFAAFGTLVGLALIALTYGDLRRVPQFNG